jgi:serine/threonine protein kinase
VAGFDPLQPEAVAHTGIVFPDGWLEAESQSLLQGLIQERDWMNEQEQGLAAARATVGMVLDGRYRLLSEGTTQDLGTAYEAYDLQRERPVFLLVLASRWGGGIDALSHRLAQVKEAQQAVAGLEAPALVPFDHVGVVDGSLYLVRSRVEGNTLADLLAQADRDNRLDIGLAVEIAIGLCEALVPAHRAGLVHGSLSPHSILVRSVSSAAGPSSPSLFQAITLVDFGLLPALRPGDLPKDQPWGRIPYLSPEQARGEQIHPVSDVYVIGCLLYQMLTGRPPFRAGDDRVLALQHQRQEPPSLRVLLPHIPPALAQIVHNALAKEPSARYRNAGQLAYILRSKVELQPPASQPALVQERLVVPPPPTPALVQGGRSAGRWSSPDIGSPYALEGDAGLELAPEEPGGTDWVMIGLLIAALIAVLGLIPLWRTVYLRYAEAPAAAASSLNRPFGQEFASAGNQASLVGAVAPMASSEDRWQYLAQGQVELDDRGFVWYNILSASLTMARSASERRANDEYWRTRIQRMGQGLPVEQFARLGVKLTGFGRKV